MSIKFEFDIFREDYHHAGSASSDIKKYLNQVGILPQVIRRIVISSYEAEMNLVIHSLGGKLILEIEENLIRLTSADKGPGIQDIELALTPGFSTANQKIREMGFGAGMGLPNMKKNSDTFSISSNPKGTIVILSWVIE